MAIRIIAALTLAAIAGSASAVTLYSCPFSGSPGDQLTRGFYVTNFPAATLDAVTLSYGGGAAGVYNVTVTARLNTYGGPVVGTATQNVDTTSGTASATFNLGGTAVPAGSTVTFSQTVNSGPGTLFYDVGVGPCPNVTQTNGTTPPLDSFRRDSVGVLIAGTLGIAPVPLAVPALDGMALAALAALLAGAAATGLRRRSDTTR